MILMLLCWQKRLCDISPQEANKEEFELSSMRCGRKLTKDGDVSRTHCYSHFSSHTVNVFHLISTEKINDIFLSSVLLAVDRL